MKNSQVTFFFGGYNILHGATNQCYVHYKLKVLYFFFSNFGLCFILLNVAMGIMLHCAQISNLKVMLKLYLKKNYHRHWCLDRRTDGQTR